MNRFRDVVRNYGNSCNNSHAIFLSTALQRAKRLVSWFYCQRSKGVIATVTVILLRIGLEAMDDPAEIDTIESRIRTGRPLASPDWIKAAEAAMNRTLGPQKAGRKARIGGSGGK